MLRENKLASQLDDGNTSSLEHRPSPLNPTLRLAAWHGVASSIRLHIEREDPLDRRDANGHTALMIAAQRNHLEVCSLLLQAGVDPDLVDKNGFTACDLAEQAGATDTHQKLLELKRKQAQLASEANTSLLQECPDKLNQDSSPVAKAAASNTQVTVQEDMVLADWESLREVEPPKDDEELRNRVSLTHVAITAHIPFDSSVATWDEVSAYLPEEIHSASFEASIEEGLRNIFLRALREASVPALQLDSLLEGEDPTTAANIKRLASQVVQDLGAELDERIEVFGFFEDYRVPLPKKATDDEQRMLDDAIEHMFNLLRPKNDPGRIFAKKAYGLPQLTQAEEVEIAKEMEQALESANDILAGWSDGLGVLLRKCTEVESGHLALKHVQGKKSTDIDEHHEADSEGEAPSPLLTHGQLHSQTKAEEDDSDPEEPHAAGELEEFVRKAALLRQLTALRNGAHQSSSEVRTVLREMCLSGTLLCSLEQQKSKQPEAIEFTSHISRFLKARDRLVLSNLKLVVPMAKRFLGTGADFSDLLQEGHIGLIRAADKFDWRRGFKFSTMATWWIRQQVSRAAPEHARLIRLPVHGVEVTWEMKRLLKTHLDQHDQPPSVSWLAQQLGLSELKTESYLRTMSEPLPLEVMESNPWLPTPEDTDPLEYVSRKECADRAEELLQHLGSRPGKKMSEKVLRMRYGIGTWEDLTLDEIGKRFGLTRERIRQIESKAITLIRGHLRAMRNPETPSSEETAAPPSDTTPSPTAREEDESIDQRSDTLQTSTSTSDSDSDGNPQRLNKVVLPRSQSSKPARSQRAFTERQLELLDKAKAIGIGVLTYLESGRYETLVMLPHMASEPEREIAAELLVAGFSFRPGHGYYV